MNTVRVVRDAGGRVLRLEGFNTDVEGFRKSIMPLVKHFAQGTGAIVLGTGGASKAAVTALRQLGLSPVRVSRSKGGDGIVSYSDLDAEFMAAHPVVVNATRLPQHLGAVTRQPAPPMQKRIFHRPRHVAASIHC